MATKRFSPHRTITKKNLEKIDDNKPCVYRITNNQSDILYVGMAKGKRLEDRVLEHKKEFKGGTNFQFRETKTKEAAQRLEKQEIKKHKPEYNKEK